MVVVRGRTPRLSPIWHPARAAPATTRAETAANTFMNMSLYRIQNRPNTKRTLSGEIQAVYALSLSGAYASALFLAGARRFGLGAQQAYRLNPP